MSRGERKKKKERLLFTDGGRMTTHLGALGSTKSGRRGLAFSG